MRDFLIILWLATLLFIIAAFYQPAHSAGCVPRHCEYTGHERICDCD